MFGKASKFPNLDDTCYPFSSLTRRRVATLGLPLLSVSWLIPWTQMKSRYNLRGEDSNRCEVSKQKEKEKHRGSLLPTKSQHARNAFSNTFLHKQTKLQLHISWYSQTAISSKDSPNLWWFCEFRNPQCWKKNLPSSFLTRLRQVQCRWHHRGTNGTWSPWCQWCRGYHNGTATILSCAICERISWLKKWIRNWHVFLFFFWSCHEFVSWNLQIHPKTEWCDMISWFFVQSMWCDWLWVLWFFCFAKICAKHSKNRGTPPHLSSI